MKTERKKKASKCAIRSRKCIQDGSPGVKADSAAGNTHIHTRAQTHVMSKYHSLGISENVDKGKLLNLFS